MLQLTPINANQKSKIAGAGRRLNIGLLALSQVGKASFSPNRTIQEAKFFFDWGLFQIDICHCDKSVSNGCCRGLKC